MGNMTRWIRFAILIIIAMLIQASLLSNLRYRPDLLLILLVFYAVYSSTMDAIIASFIIGLASNIISLNLMGTGIIAFGIVGTALAYLQRTVSLRNVIFAGFAIFFAGFLCGLIISFLSYLKTGQAGNIMNLAVWTSLYSAVAGPFLFGALKWFSGLETKHPRRY